MDVKERFSLKQIIGFLREADAATRSPEPT